MTSQELRAAFIDFFVERGHMYVAPASLIPDALSTTLFTIAGMEPFVPAFLGEVAPPAARVVSVQPCLRVAGAKSDIENVGRTGRHGTFLEMLGNFSFGDYYKREAIAFAWDFLTRVLGLDASKLYVTVHVDDDEAQRLWETEIGLAAQRITRWNEDNFWTMGPTGPCGPCSEIFYDTGLANAAGPADTGPNLGNRYVEIWNLVFQQYDRSSSGALTELPSKNIDTGAGFERLLAVINGKASMYETDLFSDIIRAQPDVGTTTLSPAEVVVRRNIIADHARAVTFLIADGVYPSNTDRGYVLRFLVRRAIRNGRLLSYPKEFLADLASAVSASLGSGYPLLQKRLADVQGALRREEESFVRTLDRGSELLEQFVSVAIKNEARQLDGEIVFRLHDTFGFPAELTREIAAERGVTVDSAGFESHMAMQRERARTDAKIKRAVLGVNELPALRSTFTGYDGLEASGTVVSILAGGLPVAVLEAGCEGQLILDRTSFYAEKGGQIGDRGTLAGDDGSFEVTDTQFVGEAIAHAGRVVSGSFTIGARVSTRVDPVWREEIRRHHTSAHLLQRALRDVLGEDIVQAGSWVGIDRMRFDFRSPAGALNATQKRAVTQRVNDLIRADYQLETREVPIAEAQRSGAISMAGEKYGEFVRIVKAGPAVEFCGGTHAVTTGELGLFLLLSEASVGSGVRRIEAVVSKAAEVYVEKQQTVLAKLADTLSAQPDDLLNRVTRLQSDLRDLHKALADSKARLASADAKAYVERAERRSGTMLVAAVVHEADAAAVRTLASAIRSRLAHGVIALVGVDGETVSIFVSASDDAVKAGVHAGNLVRAAASLLGGKGGGAAAQAQGGGKNVAGAEAALTAIRAAII